MIFSRYVEILDKATCIPAIATHVDPGHPIDSALLGRAGYRGSYIILTQLSGLRSEHSSAEWNDRTMSVAHAHLEEWFLDGAAFNVNVPDGKILDVEFILGETKTQRTSDCHTYTIG